MNIGIILLIVLVFAALIVYGIWSSAKRRQALQAWAATRGLSFSAGKEYGFDERFPGFACLCQGDERYAYNVMGGRFQDRFFLGFDYHYETHSRDSKGRRQTHHHHFSAVVLSSKVPLEPLFIRPEGFLDKITEFFGLDDIDFESAEFSRKFYVKAANKRWAYDVIHPQTMEFLLSQPQFTLQFDRENVIAFRPSTFRPADFEGAATVVHGILKRLPPYLVKQQTKGPSP